MLLQQDNVEPAPPAGPDDAPHRRAARAAVPVALVAILAVPMLVAAVAMADPTWYAHDDYALTEMHLRDATSTSPPLVGLGGRIRHDGVAGNHPGPLSFYLLTPVYRLLGSSSWAMQMSTAVLGLVAIGLAVWIAGRRGGRTGMLAAAAGMVALLVAYGPERWMLPWNPSLPLLWWPVVLLAAWSVLCRDWPMVLVFAAAASFCAQTHISYVGLVAGLGLMLAVWMARAAWAGRRGRHAAAPDATGADATGHRRGPAAWLAAGVAVLVVLWIPPIVDQVTHDPGNASIILGQFLDPDEETAEPTAGWGAAVDVALDRLDPWGVASGRVSDMAQVSAGGVVALVAWVAAAAVAVARRRRLPPDLPRLHAVVAVAAVLGLVSVSRIQGRVFAYLSLWWWGTGLVMLAATVWTAVAVANADAVARGDAADRPARWARAAVGGRAALVGAVAVGAGVASVDAARHGPVEPGNRLGTHAEVFPVAFDALADGRVDGFGPDDRYMVSAADGYTGGMSAFTVLNEMERRGFDAGISDTVGTAAGEHRIVEPGEATAVVTYAAGAAIGQMRSDPDAVELASADLPPEAAAAADEARADAAAALERGGRADLVPQLDTGVFAMLINEPDLPDAAIEPMETLLELGAPVAVFVAPAPEG